MKTQITSESSPPTEGFPLSHAISTETLLLHQVIFIYKVNGTITER